MFNLWFILHSFFTWLFFIGQIKQPGEATIRTINTQVSRCFSYMHKTKCFLLQKKKL